MLGKAYKLRGAIAKSSECALSFIEPLTSLIIPFITHHYT
jgi:hypothetical protein